MKGSKIKAVLTLLFMGFLGALHAQAPDSLRFQRAIQVEATFVTSDHLANTYLISVNNAIEKYDSLGRQMAAFTNKRLGNATFLDASNPLKILVWYPDFQTVLWLDRTLTEMGRLDFTKIDLYSVRCVAMAFDGNIWVFDDAISKAIKLSLDGLILLESPPLNIYFPRRFSATRIRDSGQFVSLNDPSSGFCSLDQYANIATIYSSFRIADFETAGEWLFYVDSTALHFQHLGHIQLFQLPLPLKIQQNGLHTWLGKQSIYWQNGKHLEQYTWQ